MATNAHGFRWPGGDDRTTLIGATGSGKTTCGVWLFSHMRFASRPWVIIDFKREQIFDAIGFPPIRAINYDTVPRRKGVYILAPNPGQEEALDDWLWRVWKKENVGLFVDEASLMPDSDAWQAILQQGRSKRIPVIACTQRPVMAKRALFSEASFFCVYRMQDKRDAKIIEGFVPADLSLPLPPHHWHWYDVARNRLLAMSPVPPPDHVADMMRAAVPSTVLPFDSFWRNTQPPRSSARQA